MAQRGRPGLSPEQKRELWSRWKAGESLSEIGRALGKQPGSIHGVVASNGGYVPAVRRRSARVLTISEREEISRGLAEGASLRRIAGRLQRAPSSISREVARHGGRHRYRAARAEERAWDRARRPKPCKLAAVPPLRELVAGKLAEEWSPEQISGWLARTYPGEQDLQVSTETIYRGLFVQARGVLRKELTAHLRTRRTMRRSRQATRSGQGRGGIVDAVSIRERLAEASDRAVPGHWEGDLLAGSANTHIATLVERQSRYVMLVKVDGKDTTTVVDALAIASPDASGPAPSEPHLGPRHGTRRPQALHRRHRRRRVLLRPSKPLAARHEREHQRTAPSVLPEEDRPLGPQPSRPGRGRCSAEHQAAQDPPVPDACC